MNITALIPNTPEVSKLRPSDTLGKTIGNFTITGLAGNGRVKATCNLCNNTQYETQWYKIKSGHSTSCGCKQKLVLPERYIGRTYNRLTITDISPEKDKWGAVMSIATCSCGNKITRPLAAIMSGKLKSCGCLHSPNLHKLDYAIQDKAEYKRVYSIWRQMLCRCYQSGHAEFTEPHLLFLNNKKPHPRYGDYGGRGITVDKEWHDRNVYYRWYKKNILPGESVDRIDNNAPYSKYNCRTATITQQNLNQRVRHDNQHGYKGVMFSGFSYGWRIKHDGKQYTKEGFKSVAHALIERNIYIVANNLPHAIQPISDRKVRSFYNNETKGFHIAYNIDGQGVGLSNTHFASRNDGVLNKVILGMNSNSDTDVK